MSQPLSQSQALLGARVEVPAYTDAWMRGDRFGEVVGLGPGGSGFGTSPRKATVRLDKSQRKVKFILRDLRVLNH